MFQPTKKIIWYFSFFVLPIVFVCENLLADSAIEKPTIKNACDLEELPIIKEETCIDFNAADNRLNKAYKDLKKKLSKADSDILKTSQKEWIKFRDTKCQSLMEAAEEKCEENSVYCGSRIPANIHDSCILEVTSSRADGLESFSMKLDYAKSKKYSFPQETSLDFKK